MYFLPAFSVCRVHLPYTDEHQSPVSDVLPSEEICDGHIPLRHVGHWMLDLTAREDGPIPFCYPAQYTQGLILTPIHQQPSWRLW